MSYYRRGYSWENVQYLPAPVGGWAPDGNPWEMPESQAPQLDNLLIRPGRLIGRGGFHVDVDLSALSPLGAAGAVVGLTSVSSPANPWFLVGRRAAGAGEWMDNVDAPGIRFTAATSLSRGTGTGLGYNMATTAQSTPVMQPTIGWRWVNFDGLLYGIAFDDLPGNTTALDVNGTYIVWKTKMLTMPNPTTGVPTATAQTAAPQGAFDIAAYQSRIWLLGGVDIPGGGTTHSCTTLFFTNPGVSGVGSATGDWKDPVSGLTNQIKMDNNIADYGVGLAKVRNGLLVFRRHSVWLLRGTTSANYTMIQISSEVGCTDARSIVETDHGVYFLSHRGLMRTDGVSVVDESGFLKHLLTEAIQLQKSWASLGAGPNGGVNTGTGYECCQMTASGDLLVTIGTGPAQGATPVLGQIPMLTALYSPSTKTWIRITSQLWSNEMNVSAENAYCPLLMTNLSGVPLIYAIGDKYITLVDSVGGGALSEPRANPLPLVSGIYDFVGPGTSGTNFYSIPMTWKTRFVPIVGTSSLMRKFGQVKRYFLDYLFAYGGNGAPTSGWTVTPIDATNTAISGAGVLVTPVGSLGSNTGRFINSIGGAFGTTFPTESTANVILRQNEDMANEVSDMAFLITSPVNNTTGVTISSANAVLHGIGIEYQPGRDLR